MLLLDIAMPAVSWSSISGGLCSCCCCSAAAAINMRAHRRATFSDAATRRRQRRHHGAEGEEHERGDCDSETCCAPDVAAALQQRLICALTGALPTAMLRRGDDGDGSTELKVWSTSAATAIARRAVLLLLLQRCISD